ncbi:hypothetical protein GGR55DRAFT_645775 [Xylaria sp. FL0064]|nr:hypothetical protein GGR55DRAFT_645775 [Xylaria sp. FL0064]
MDTLRIQRLKLRRSVESRHCTHMRTVNRAALADRVTHKPKLLPATAPGIPFMQLSCEQYSSVSPLRGCNVYPLSCYQMAETPRVGQVNSKSKHKSAFGPFSADVLQSIISDTIYTFQDVTKPGVKSVELKLRHTAKALASVLKVAQVSLPVMCEIWAEFSVLYFVETGTIGAITATHYMYDTH